MRFLHEAVLEQCLRTRVAISAHPAWPSQDSRFISADTRLPPSIRIAMLSTSNSSSSVPPKASTPVKGAEGREGSQRHPQDDGRPAADDDGDARLAGIQRWPAYQG
jgi:hypothetical protein